jgi:hypothetical protein
MLVASRPPEYRHFTVETGKLRILLQHSVNHGLHY